MELQEMLDVVECGWQFVPSNYPATEHMSEQQLRTFALTHILKHQRRTTNILKHIQDSRLLVDLGVLKERICKLLVNSIRLVQFAEPNPELVRFNNHLVIWDSRAEKEVSSSFQIIKTGRSFKKKIEDLEKLCDETLELTEAPDHGDFKNLDVIDEQAWAFLLLSIQIASKFGLSREEFEQWLTSDYFKVQLHA